MSSRVANKKLHPLDLSRVTYSYLERPNPGLQALAKKHLSGLRAPRVVDIGCGCGTNARALKERMPSAYVVGVEMNEKAAGLARTACDEVYAGSGEEWLRANPDAPPFDALILADVLEHIADPIHFLRTLAGSSSLQDAVWIISVPNYGLWHNRAKTLLGVQGYAWNGLWDRTHLRFFTRRTIRELLEYCGLEVEDETWTPSFAQSTSGLTRKLFERGEPTGEHLALADSRAYAIYRSVVEPIETRVCALWPELLAFQIVAAARLAR
jgi:2-polyprenyl-3-methyl-5-hydroxy-6-metoxy-1,4-benzoquinol methylase